MKTGHKHSGCCSGGHDHEKSNEFQFIDPVCGMTVDPKSSKHVTHNGTDYYFCSPHCVTKFTESPDKYLTPKEATPPVDEDAEAEAIYTCPMHPEVRQKGPGSCPICGMALEPVAPSLEEGPNMSSWT